jgi:ribosome-associated heat shock protein Hsp15
VEVLALPEKRGPARAAQACYRILDPRGESDIGAGEAQIAEGDARP